MLAVWWHWALPAFLLVNGLLTPATVKALLQAYIHTAQPRSSTGQLQAGMPVGLPALSSG